VKFDDPISLAAAKATLEQLEEGSVHETLERSGEFLGKEIMRIVNEEGIFIPPQAYKRSHISAGHSRASTCVSLSIALSSDFYLLPQAANCGRIISLV
jgi:hypothetical protein